MSEVDQVVRIPPLHFIHILDTNTNVTRLVLGPETTVCLAHERLVEGPTKVIVVPPGHSCTMSNPVVKRDNAVVLDANGQPLIRQGESEVRLSDASPFAVYPGERAGAVVPLDFIPQNNALRLRAPRDLPACNGLLARRAGEEWLFVGPGLYVPSDAEIVERISAFVLSPLDAVIVQARRDCTDANGKVRKAGESWMYRKVGAFIPGVDETLVERVSAHLLTADVALHLRAKRPFTDVYGKMRRVGDEWLITRAESPTHLVDVDEELVARIERIVLPSTHYCVVANPVDEQGVAQRGRRENRVGPKTFFLQPGEVLDSVPTEVPVIAANQAILMMAQEDFQDHRVARKAGDNWVVYGPCAYVPPVEGKRTGKWTALSAIDSMGIYIFPTPVWRLIGFVVVILVLYQLFLVLFGVLEWFVSILAYVFGPSGETPLPPDTSIEHTDL